MSATDWLRLVYIALPAAFLLDLAIFPFAIWWLRRWRRLRAGR